MPQNISVRNWLAQNNYEDVASLVDAVMNGWREKGTKTRRNWWDVLAGGKNGRPRTIEGITFPVLKVAQIRMGVPVTDNAISRNDNEDAPPKTISGRWLRDEEKDTKNAVQEL